MSKGNKLYLIGLAAFAVIAASLAGYANRPQPQLDRIIDKEYQRVGVFQMLTAGCTSAAVKMQNEEALMMINATRGKACLSMLADTVTDILSGHGPCSADDNRCLFTQGYVALVIRVLHLDVDTIDDYNKLQADIKETYEKINPTKESQE